MPEHHKKKKFLHLPEYPGGSTAMKEFVTANLRYPAAAMESKVEGSVIIGYEVHDDGTVRNPRVLKGLGHGCDEEALRLISLLRFEKVKNRGKRVQVTKKTRINFNLPKVTSQLTVSYQSEPQKPISSKEPEKKDPVVYNYTIDL
jgi:TonB family protein